MADLLLVAGDRHTPVAPAEPAASARDGATAPLVLAENGLSALRADIERLEQLEGADGVDSASSTPQQSVPGHRAHECAHHLAHLREFIAALRYRHVACKTHTCAPSHLNLGPGLRKVMTDLTLGWWCSHACLLNGTAFGTHLAGEPCAPAALRSSALVTHIGFSIRWLPPHARATSWMRHHPSVPHVSRRGPNALTPQERVIVWKYMGTDGAHSQAAFSCVSRERWERERGAGRVGVERHEPIGEGRAVTWCWPIDFNLPSLFPVASGACRSSAVC